MSNNIDESHDPDRTSWVISANGHPDFPIQNLPFGVFSPKAGGARCGVAIGDYILDLSLAVQSDLLKGVAYAADAGVARTFNGLLAQPPKVRRDLRRCLSELLTTDALDRAEVDSWLYPSATCILHLPTRIGDYTDFYAGIEHALNVGRLFRPDSPLLPNYKHVPVGYHGRASSVRPSGAPVRRPNGQYTLIAGDAPTFGQTQRLDIELELAVWIGQGNALGAPIPIEEAGEHIAGLGLLNDWSARDFQTWEYQPLGPFLAKNFQTTVSPWIITTEALAPYRVPQPARAAEDPRPLPYLWSDTDQAHGAYAIALEVLISTAAMRKDDLAPHKLSTGSATNLYWTAAQLVAHHASGGCDLNPGDLFGTGTISTPTDEGLGSLLEITRGGQTPIRLPSGEHRTFLEDGDEITLVGRASAPGFVDIGFGPCIGRITPGPLT